MSGVENGAERSGPKIGWSGAGVAKKTMEQVRNGEREVAEWERSGKRAASAAHSLLHTDVIKYRKQPIHAVLLPPCDIGVNWLVGVNL